MQVKTIKKIIKGKVEEWLQTIEDIKLRDRVRQNYLVSGGSITSLFQGEPVNDFDIYIQNMDVLVELAKYYCPGVVLDGRKRQTYLENHYQNKYGKNNWKYHFDTDLVGDISEQTVRLKNLKDNQVKLDIPSFGIQGSPKSELKEDGTIIVPKYQVSFLSQNAISLSDDLQIVLRFNGNAEEIHKTFDFIHATNYYTFEEGLVTNIEALQCIITKTLKYQGSLYPLTSIIRIKKFLNRGWSINAGEMLKIMFQISELNLRDPEVLEEQLIGVDVAYFAKLISILRGTNSEDMTTQYLNTIIDKVFSESNDEDEK